MTFTCFFQVPVQCEKFKPNTWYRLSDFFSSHDEANKYLTTNRKESYTPIGWVVDSCIFLSMRIGDSFEEWNCVGISDKAILVRKNQGLSTTHQIW